MRKTVVIIVLSIIAACVAWGFFGRNPAKTPAANPSGADSEPLKDAGTKKTTESSTLTERSASGETAPDARTAGAAEEPRKPQPQDFGRAVAVKADASPQAASVAEALKRKDHPERLSVLIAPKPFDKAAFEANPKNYLASIEPGRCFQCAQPGKDVPVLTVQSPSMCRIKQGESVKLTVKGAPFAPASFTSFDLGTFAESKLNCVTVRADKDGVASVTFVATPGALNDCNVLAGSPLASGQAKFVVEIEETGVR